VKTISDVLRPVNSFRPVLFAYVCRHGINCIAPRWRLGLCGMLWVIGNGGKIFNHGSHGYHGWENQNTDKSMI
jgi:hypothetical protein